MIDGWILKSGLILAGMHRVYEDRLILFFSSSFLKRNGKSGYLDELIQDRRNDLEYVCNFFDTFVLGRFVLLEIIRD